MLISNLGQSFKKDEREIQSAGSKLFVSMIGSGEALLLLHGGLVDHRLWSTQQRRFASSHLVICPDLRGHGKSETAKAEWCFETDIMDVLDHLGVEQAHLIGHSLGARVAINFALINPDRVRSLFLLGPGVDGLEDPEEVTADMLLLKALVDEGKLEEASQIWLGGTYMQKAMQQDRHQSLLVQWSLQNLPFLAQDWSQYKSALQEVALKRLCDIKMPVSILVGEQDPHYIRSHTLSQMLSYIPHAEGTIVPDCGHLHPLERPMVVNTLLEQHLEKCALQDS